MAIAIAPLKTRSFYERIALLSIFAVIACGLFIFRYVGAKSYKGLKKVLNSELKTFVVGSGCFFTRDSYGFAS